MHPYSEHRLPHLEKQSNKDKTSTPYTPIPIPLPTDGSEENDQTYQEMMLPGVKIKAKKNKITLPELRSKSTLTHTHLKNFSPVKEMRDSPFMQHHNFPKVNRNQHRSKFLMPSSRNRPLDH